MLSRFFAFLGGGGFWTLGNVHAIIKVLDILSDFFDVCEVGISCKILHGLESYLQPKQRKKYLKRKKRSSTVNTRGSAGCCCRDPRVAASPWI